MSSAKENVLKWEAEEEQRKQITRDILALCPLPDNFVLRKVPEVGDGSKVRITVYRALVGCISFNRDAGYPFSGFSENELLQKGILCDNNSPVQNRLPSDEFLEPAGNPSVPGLPVFLTLGGAVWYMHGKRYTPNLPAIAILNLPFISLDSGGEMRVVRNTAYKESDYELDFFDLINHAIGTKPVTGECYLQRRDRNLLAPDIRDDETLIVPNGLDNAGFIDVKRGFRIIHTSSL